MKLSMAALLLFLGATTLFAQPVNYITCGSSADGLYSLEIEVDVLESLPAQSLVKLYIEGELVAQERATKDIFFFETYPEQIVYSFNFIEDEEFEFLRVNITKMKAYMVPGFVDSMGKMIEINFQACELE